MIIIAEVNGTLEPRILSRHETFADARNAAYAAFYPVFFEDDPDHAHSADFIACDGRQYVIQPTKR